MSATNRKPVYRNKDWLYEQYWGELKSVSELADEAGCGGRTIRDWMETHGIPRRPENYCDALSPVIGFYDV